MGTYEDMAQRKSLAHIDNVDRRSRVEAAHEAIYVKNSAVDGVAVEALLKAESLVPTAVSSCFILHIFGTTSHFMFTSSERIFQQTMVIWFQHLRQPRSQPVA
jgi:hypothetical protein